MSGDLSAPRLEAGCLSPAFLGQQLEHKGRRHRPILGATCAGSRIGKRAAREAVGSSIVASSADRVLFRAHDQADAKERDAPRAQRTFRFHVDGGAPRRRPQFCPPEPSELRNLRRHPFPPWWAQLQDPHAGPVREPLAAGPTRQRMLASMRHVAPMRSWPARVLADEARSPSPWESTRKTRNGKSKIQCSQRTMHWPNRQEGDYQ
mmetsp:Transcript_24002/g.74346  ORF Transcript_24002/g.74346 Transcript_24002/m.74346 type:complete len:206 (+) Transcript_24002:212-829(+)